MGSTWGNHIKISIFGESHGKGVGVVIDGFPAGFECNMEYIKRDLTRRAPGGHGLTTGRKEEDAPVILAGILDGITTGAPIMAMINNSDTRSKDYEQFRTIPRPGHSDYAGQVRYKGYNDIRGGGHFSGRLTAPLTFAGALCKDFLKKYHNIEIGSHIYRIGEVFDLPFDLTSVDRDLLCQLQLDDIPVLNNETEKKIIEEVLKAKSSLDSIGGVIECAVVGADPGIGSPIFNNVESRIASILYSIPAVKGVEFGFGFELAGMRGSEANDCFTLEDGIIKTTTNYSGGILGGITTGMPIIVRAVFKPTPSIGREQRTLNLVTGEEEKLWIHGRHDPCIALRAPVVVEASVAIAMMDLYLEAYGYDAK
ncbi:MAG: chorismate synthase [Anaerovoracaceae bacterium]|nr:chorismate synthase [Clostridiales bacterium]